jgi:energy-converting hydrogenase B subunit D
MGFPVTLILLIIAIVIAILSLTVKDLLAAIIILSAFSFTAAILYAELGAVDVSFTEAAVGAGLSGVFMIAALFFLKRRSED